ncbi:MAG: alanine--tRNA ligase [Bacilli bacterium]|nr:alanine--tRNA ligase [Bacilli bacterium]
MKPLTGREIRETWIRFFESKGHQWLPGVSLVPQGDKSLLWVNAGVTGLKKYFDGTEIPPNRRITNVQKSIRTNDIENVGHTARHHTFFEMLGNFSIGDYFRNEVIPWAVELLTDEKWFGFPKEKLYITYNPADKASLELWVKCGMLESHMVPLEGNFWEIGEGPCGPDTEIFFDRGEAYDPNGLGERLLREDMENDRYVEIWNIVFSQFNSVSGVKREDYKELPSKNIDTGSGLERIACIMQETPTNFETDLFMPIIKRVEEISGMKYEAPNLMPFRVIADHARCLTFALSDGATFSNEGRGYVLRRIIRRAMRYGQKIGIKRSFMYELVDVVVENYKSFYPYIADKALEVKEDIKLEEEKFLTTLTAGEEILRTMIEGKSQLSGEEVFKLYDTYGFPADLTRDIAGESGVSVDLEGFEVEMEKQRERARSARGEIVSFNKQSKDLMAFKEESKFLYCIPEMGVNAKVVGCFKEGVAVETIEDEGDIVLSETIFYAEMGGQVADKGRIGTETGCFEVTNVTKAPHGQHLHHVKAISGSISVGQVAVEKLDEERRAKIEKNHSATHILHAALNEVLEGHATQAGSYVDDEYLRFDYQTKKKTTKEEIEKIEAIVNAKIEEAIEEITEELPIEEAKKLGAEMTFADKYGDVVRVVEFGEFSREFCGGTHVRNTSEIGLFVVVSDESVASGVRRITGLTGTKAYRYLKDKIALLNNVEAKLGASDVDVLKHVDLNNEEIASLKAENSELKAKVASAEAKKLADNVEKVNGVDFALVVKDGANRDELTNIGDSLKANRSDYIFILVGGNNGAYPVIVFTKGNGTNVAKAGDIVKSLASTLGGGGGGRPEMASGSLKSIDGIEGLANAIKAKI